MLGCEVIMRLISSISYSILINGHLYEYIIPSRGLQQEDPLSPYLFLIYAEGLLTMLRQRTKMKSMRCWFTKELFWYHIYFLLMIVCHLLELPIQNAVILSKSYITMNLLLDKKLILTSSQSLLSRMFPSLYKCILKQFWELEGWNYIKST